MTESSGASARPRTVRVRRAPKFSVFLIVGGGLGAIVAFVATALFPVDPNVGFGALFGYFSLYGITAGVLFGGITALILDRVSLRRARVAAVELSERKRPE